MEEFNLVEVLFIAVAAVLLVRKFEELLLVDVRREFSEELVRLLWDDISVELAAELPLSLFDVLEFPAGVSGPPVIEK